MDRHVCAVCGKPRALASDETFFAALGLPEKFSQDPADLQKRFYQVSRALHPDRFGTADAHARQRSLERMSFVNEAYTTLRDPRSLREYVLSLHGLKSEVGARGQIPMELAELWFELQDDLSDENVARFRAELAQAEEALDQRISGLEVRLDALDPAGAEYREGLEELSQAARERNYLDSINRDLQSRLQAKAAR